MKYSAVFALSVALGASARPQVVRRADFTLKNGQDAIALNDKFKTLTADSACDAGENACIQDQFAQCANGKFVTTACGTGTVCAALPLVNSAGTSITCTTAAERDQRIAATGATGAGAGAGAGASSSAAGASSSAAGASSSAAPPASTTSAVNNAGGGAGATSSAAGAAPTGGGDAQSSPTIDPANIQKLTNDGQDQPTAGQVASLTSSNNYINFCLNNGAPTNGAQVKGGSCNQVPMGQIPSTANQVSCAFQFPVNGQNIDANTDFTIKMNIQGMQTGFFTNAAQTYYMAPQQLNKAGQVMGHSHVTMEQIESLQSTKPLDPNKFIFFKGLNEAAQGGVLSADVAGGAPPGTYKISSINAAANHQPFLGPIAQRGSYDCVTYFTVGDASNTGNALGGGAGAGNATAGAGGAGAGAGGAGAATSSAAAAGASQGAATSSAAAAGASNGAAAGGAGAGAASTSSAAAAGATDKGAAAAGKGAAAGAATSSAAAAAASGKGAADAGKAGADAGKGAAAGADKGAAGASSAAGADKAAPTDKGAQGKGN